MSKTLGCDFSFWNGIVDFNKMKSAGMNFVYCKASQLTTDTQFKNYWRDAKGLLPRGAYHYLDWRTSELTQAKLFTDSMVGDWGELPPMLDLEQDPAQFGLNASEVQGRVWNFLQAVEKTTGKIPIIYTGYYYWLQWMTPNLGWGKYPFWLAWYADESIIKVPPPWTKWTIWQYSGNGNGPLYGSSGLSLDMDYFNGTPEELRLFAGSPSIPSHPDICPYCGQKWPQEAPQPPTPPPFVEYVVICDIINVRAGPASTATWVRYARRDEVLKVTPKRENGYAQLLDGNWVYESYIKLK